MFKDLIKKLAS